MKLRIVIGVVLLTLFTVSSVDAQHTLTLEQCRQQFMQAFQLFEKEDYQNAAVGFEHLRGQYPELDDYVLYLLANSYLKRKEEQKALAVFQEFLARYPSHPLKYDVQLNTAHLLFAKQEYPAARDLYRQLLGHPDIEPPGEIYYRLGKVFLALQKPDDAVFSFHQMVFLYPEHPARKEAQQQLETLFKKDPALRPQWTEGTLLRSARAFFEAKWYKTAAAQYETFKKQYPKSSQLEECEFQLVDAYFRSGQSQKGMTALQQLTKHKNANIAARAMYIIGARQWNSDYNTQARTTMQQLLKDYAHTYWADNAYYVIGRIYQGTKAYQDAAKWYQALYTYDSGSSFAEEALWRAGWCYYLAAHYPEATQVFLQAHSRFAEGSYADDTLYWLGRTQEQQKSTEEAISTYQQLLQFSPDSYYGLLARERLHALNVKVTLPQSIKAEPEMSQLIAQIQQLLPSENYAQIQPHLAKIFELRRVNLRKYAVKEAEWVESLVGDGSELFDTKETRGYALVLRYFLSRLYIAAGHYLKAIQWASRLEIDLEDEENRRFSYTLDTFPYRLDTLKYPLGYWELITTYSAANDLDPFLIAAMIRQESAYDPDALSSAEAHGLMQVLPTTGSRLAKTLKLKKFTTSQLYDPELSIKLGTYYFAELLEKFEGNLYRALAAYNAGPAATNKWWPAKGAIEQEIIIENISYRETQNYVKRVLRDQDQYRRLYAHLLQP